MEDLAKGIYISMIDIIGIFIPGFLFMIGLFSLIYQLSPNYFEYFLFNNYENFEWLTKPFYIILSFIFSYVIGFILRLSSIGLIQIITRSKWESKLKESSNKLEQLITKLLDSELNECLTDLRGAKGKLELSHTAPLFQLAKRIVRHSSPSLWADAERLEAEMRFLSGLFIPLLLILTDFIILLFNTYFNIISIFLVIVTIGSIGIIIYVFPIKRIREILYVYFSAIIILKKIKS